MSDENQLERLAISFAEINNISFECLFFPDFLVVGSDIIEESEDCILFVPHKIYGWDNSTCSYSLGLFVRDGCETVGVWQHNTLALYQDISLGYLRLSYLVKNANKETKSSVVDSDRKIYCFYIDISTDGIYWKRYGRGEYGHVLTINRDREQE